MGWPMVNAHVDMELADFRAQSAAQEALFGALSEPMNRADHPATPMMAATPPRCRPARHG
jgi:hypothetical protein